MNGPRSLDPSPGGTGRRSARKIPAILSGRGAALFFALLVTGLLAACATIGANERGRNGEAAAVSASLSAIAEGVLPPSPQRPAAVREALPAQGYDVEPGEARAADADGSRAANDRAGSRGHNRDGPQPIPHVRQRANDEGK